MRIAALYSGGKDSTYAAWLAQDELVCLVSVRSKNPDSFMFHTPAAAILELQAEAIGLPLVLKETAGEKEDELEDLKRALMTAKQQHAIQGIVTGALASTYQAARIQRICHELGLWCFNPLWQMRQEDLLDALAKDGFHAVIVGIAAEPLDQTWLGRNLDDTAIAELVLLSHSHDINPAGEGGEFETIVLDSPLHKRRLEIVTAEKQCQGFSGRLLIKQARVADR